MNEVYDTKTYDDYFDSQQKQHSYTEIPSGDVKKTLFLVNIRKNVYDAILKIINWSNETNFQGVNKELGIMLDHCVEKLNQFVIQNDLKNGSEVIESLNKYKKRQNDLKKIATASPMEMILYSDSPPCASAIPTVFRVCSFLT
jgi:hypothetical protein